MLVNTQTNGHRPPKVGGVRRRVVVLIVVIIILISVAAYSILQAARSGEASIAISFLSKTGSCSLSFRVTNNDNKILHGWTASIKISPVESNISVSPTLAPVYALAPQGSYNGTFTVTFVGVVPPGRYGLQATLLNGTITLANSNTLSCIEPSS